MIIVDIVEVILISKQIIELKISHNQITVFNPDYDPNICQWGDVNISQGGVINESSITVDPLVDDDFSANVTFIYDSRFIRSPQSLRVIRMPFRVIDPDNLSVISIFDEEKITLPLTSGDYELYYEVCQGDDVFYIFTFIDTSSVLPPVFLMDDHWGGKLNHKLIIGKS